MSQPREGQAYDLAKSDNQDAKTTHVAVSKDHGFQYFCRFDGETYWVTPCTKYGSTYHYSSLFQGAFDFVPLDRWGE
jgi:hypothetical protein